MARGRVALMCLLLAAWRVHPRYDLAVAANRDEWHARPSLPLHFWPDHPGLLAGRDLTAGGTWLGTDARGRFAAVTNFHEPPPREPPPDRHSRGELVRGFLTADDAPAAWLTALEPRAQDYAGFNLLLADRESLWYASNRARPFARPLEPGVYGLSNHLLDTPWPKTVRGRAALAAWSDAGSTDLAPLRALLRDARPDAGTTLPWPAGSGPFVDGEEYGTRSSTWFARETALLRLGEENFAPRGRSTGMAQFSVGLPDSPRMPAASGVSGLT